MDADSKQGVDVQIGRTRLAVPGGPSDAERVVAHFVADALTAWRVTDPAEVQS